MTWFRIDDRWASHDKVRDASKNGRALWVTAGTMCAAANSDGRVSRHVAGDAAHLAEVPLKGSAASLVSSGLWHDHSTLSDCQTCEAVYRFVDPEGFVIHDWWDYQLSKDEATIPVERKRWRRRKALHRDAALLERILERDGTLCRYCGERVDFRDRRGPKGGTYDHVDPDGDNSLANVVVACRGCNIAKADRTPEEAGMTLLPPLGTKPVSDPDQNGTKSGASRDQYSRPRHARLGTGQVGIGSVSDSGQIGVNGNRGKQ